MSRKVKEFRSLIYKHFDTESDFARALKWNKQRLNKITNGSRTPSLDDLYEFSAPLKTAVGDLAKIFLSQKSTNGQQDEVGTEGHAS